MGVTGRKTRFGWARSNTWGTAASVTRQVLLSNSEGIDSAPTLVFDEAFSQDFIGVGEVGDRNPPTPELQAVMRYEQLDSFLAMACGSVAAPAVVSSTAANSLVAYRHVIDLAPELTHYATLAADLSQYVAEIPSAKIRGFTLSFGDNGRLNVSFPTVGNRTVYDSAVNTRSTVWGAAQALPQHMVQRGQGRVRINLQSAGSLTASNVIGDMKDFTFTYARPLAQDDHVIGSDSIIEPDDDGLLEATMAVNYPRMHTLSSNSMVVAANNGDVFKMDIFFQGAFINSTTRRSLLIEMPAVQIDGASLKAAVTGHQQIRPSLTFLPKRAASAPTGMTGITAPFRVTVVNANSANLLA